MTTKKAVKTADKPSTKKTTAKTSSQKQQPAKTKANGKVEQFTSTEAAQKRTATFASDEFKQKMSTICKERAFKRTAKRDFDKMSAAQQRSILVKREYHAARKAGEANPFQSRRKQTLGQNLYAKKIHGDACR
jgi:hypothetical protein